MGAARPGLVDLCCGAGGFSYGFWKAGWKPLLGADQCRHTLLTYRRNLRAATVRIDLLAKDAIETLQAAVASHTVLAVIAGPPCQGFSRAGRRKLVDPRNEVILSAARAAVSLNPELIVFENVRNITVARYEEFLVRVMCTLRRNGYAVSYRLLNALHFGVAQDRERLVLIGSRKRTHDEIASALSTLFNVRSEKKTVSQALNGIPVDPDKPTNATEFSNHIPMRHSRKVREKIARILPGDGPLSYRKLHPDQPAATLICGHRALPCHYATSRTITVREAARLQGFPDTFVFRGPTGSQMLQVANSVPPPLAAGIGETVKALLRAQT
jgi:DNA (cytosine-5)-methyltransferase 1